MLEFKLGCYSEVAVEDAREDSGPPRCNLGQFVRFLVVLALQYTSIFSLWQLASFFTWSMMS